MSKPLDRKKIDFNHKDPKPVDLNKATIAFPANALEFMPKWEDIPREFKSENSWTLFVSSWFHGEVDVKKHGFLLVEGIDGEKAFQHLSAVLRSYAPKHEHKIAAAGYLLSKWVTKIIPPEKMAEQEEQAP
jgi:hypothetical protein